MFEKQLLRVSAILPWLTSVFLFSVNVIVFLDCGFSNGFYSFPEFYVIRNVLYIQIWIKFFFLKRNTKQFVCFVNMNLLLLVQSFKYLLIHFSQVLHFI